MLVGDKNLLKATLAKGVLEIQLALIQLYTDNLNSIGTQANLLAGFALTGLWEALCHMGIWLCVFISCEENKCWCGVV